MNTVLISDLMQTSGVQFGTSGARGLVSAMTDAVCYAYTTAFLQHLRDSGQLHQARRIALAGDYRHSTTRILEATARAVCDAGLTPEYCGRIPAPALAYYGIQQQIPSLMVTGSHIPDDRNGIKFNSAHGEILKTDEAGIRAQRVALPAVAADGMFSIPSALLPEVDPRAYQHYVQRYVAFFPNNMLAQTHIGLYQHSSVARDIFFDILTALGARVTKLAPSEQFISVDTEAIRPEDIRLARHWAQHASYTALISADGDADRPLIGDEHGVWLRGDIAGILCARYLKAEVVVTPVSSNTALEQSRWFKQVKRTRIGSPYVVEAMQSALPSATGPVVGYEANGGFLTAGDIHIEHRTLSALPTRDAMIVPLALLALARQRHLSLSQLTAELPPRFTVSGRVEDFPTAMSQARLRALHTGEPEHDHRAIDAIFMPLFGRMRELDTTDGLRITFHSTHIVHLRPSGNAPEFRCYVEADSIEQAQSMLEQCITLLEQWKNSSADTTRG